MRLFARELLGLVMPDFYLSGVENCARSTRRSFSSVRAASSSVLFSDLAYSVLIISNSLRLHSSVGSKVVVCVVMVLSSINCVAASTECENSKEGVCFGLRHSKS